MPFITTTVSISAATPLADVQMSVCLCVCVFALGFSVIAFHYVFLASPPWVSSVPPHNHMIIIMTVKVFFSHPVYLAKTNIANIDRAGIYSHLFCFFVLISLQ